MRKIMMLALLAATACGQPAQNGQVDRSVNAADPSPTSNVAMPAPASPGLAHGSSTKTSDAEPVAAPGSPGTVGGLPDDRTPLSEPKGPINYKRSEAAGQVVQRYGALIEERKFAEARTLWGDGGKGSGKSQTEFAADFADYAVIHSEVGKPYDGEGAAGSIFIQVPFHLYGTTKAGKRFNLIGPLTLRRVNDVDGATPAQLHWHIAQSALIAKG